MGTPAISAQIVGTDSKAQETVRLDKDGKLQVEVPAEMTCSTLSLRTVGRYGKPMPFKPKVDIDSDVSSFELVTKSNKLVLNYVKNGRTFTVHNAKLVEMLTKRVKDQSDWRCIASAR